MLFCCVSVDKTLVTSVASVSIPVTQSRHVLFAALPRGEGTIASIALKLVLVLTFTPVVQGVHVLIHSFFACESFVTSIAGMVFVIPVVQGVHVLFSCVLGAEAANACLTLVTHLDTELSAMTRASLARSIVAVKEESVSRRTKVKW
jgi:hypothetical protein